MDNNTGGTTAPAETVYRPGARTTWMLHAILLMWLLASLALPFSLPADGTGKRWLLAAPGAAFGLLMALVTYAGAWRMRQSNIQMSPQSFTYALAPNTFWRNPFSMNSGTVRYDAIKGVETRQEWIKGKGVKAWYTSVYLVRDGVARETFARSGVGDRAWIEAFAKDVANRAGVALVERGEFNAQYYGMNHPW